MVVHLQIEQHPQPAVTVVGPICVDEVDDPSAAATLTLRLSSEEADAGTEQRDKSGRHVSISDPGQHQSSQQHQQSHLASKPQAVVAHSAQMNPLLVEEASPSPEQNPPRANPPLAFPTFQLHQLSAATPCGPGMVPHLSPSTAPANLNDGNAFQAEFPTFNSMLTSADPLHKRQKRRLSPVPDATSVPMSAAIVDGLVGSRRPNDAQLQTTANAADHDGAVSTSRALHAPHRPPHVTQCSHDNIVSLFDAASPEQPTSLLHPNDTWLQRARAMGICADNDTAAKEAINKALNAQSGFSAASSDWPAQQSSHSLQTAEAQSSKLHQAHVQLDARAPTAHQAHAQHYAQPPAVHQPEPINLVDEDPWAMEQSSASPANEYERLQQVQLDADMAAQLQEEHAGEQLADLHVRSCSRLSTAQ